jgi:type IV pilus assembly protein PilV
VEEMSMRSTLIISANSKKHHRQQRGTTLLEVLVTLVILAIGLLGLAGLQSRLQVSEMEAYQRAQALILLNDMAGRVASNRANAEAYAFYDSTDSTKVLGAGMTCPTGSSLVAMNAGAWCRALQGTSEKSGGNVGAMVGGRGCIEKIGGLTGDPVGEYLITVAWQGLTPLAAPPASVACGKDQYDGGTNCTNDACRRTVTTIVRIADLS